MALIVGLSAVVGDKGHGVVLGDVLGELGNVLGDTVPQSWDRLNVLVQTQHKAVLLLVLSHEAEWVVVNIAEKLNARLNTPVPFVLEHERVAEEESGFVAAHVPVADRVTVDDLSPRHVFSCLFRLLLVNPLRERPVLFGNQSVFSLSRSKSARDLLERVVKSFVVQKDPVVMELVVEAVLDLTDRS